MAGLSNIPVLGKFVERISDATVNAIFRGLRYLFCYKELLNVLDSEIEKVSIQEGRVSKKSAAERDDGKIIEEHVSKWMREVKELKESAKELKEKSKNKASWMCLKCLAIPKPVSRFRMGLNAVQKTKSAADFVNSGVLLLGNEIAHFPPIENLRITDGAFHDFPSRKDVYGKLWEELTSAGCSLIIGIYGMPGVGKTRMMEQILQEANEKEIFQTVARANVGSERLDIMNLQTQIANGLNCHFLSQDNVESRATQLKNSLMNKQGKILIILDDVWSEIPLENIIGTSFGQSSSSKGSKILLTSRNENVCLQNKCKFLVQVGTLTDEEAWDLFQDTVDCLQDETLAREVCTKCAGLPLMLCAVGKSLKHKPQYPYIWRDALQKLDKGNFERIDGIDPQVYACVKLSIDALQEDTKLCLFLCSLFPEDADIHIKTLIQFAIGSQLILNGETTVRAMVDFLTISSLLLKCDEDHIIKLHDIIRGVARSIASRDPKYAFLYVRCDSRWVPDNAGYSTMKLLRLDVECDDARFPEDLVCTHLNTLWLQCNHHLQHFSGGFFGMFVNLGCLMLQNVIIHSEQFSLQPLGKLKMLSFDNCDIRNTDVSLFPKNLKTLCIWGCNLPSPLDLPKLEYLQKLDIQQELPKVLMVPNVIGSLSSLEELCMPNGFTFSDDAKDETLILDEMSKLTRLTSLKILLTNFEACQGTSIFFKLIKYDIFVGSRLNTQDLPDSARMIELVQVKVKSDEGFQSLLERAEEVKLRYTNVDVNSIWNSNREAFTDLKDLLIQSCDTVEYIARMSQDKILHSRQPQTSFSKVTSIKIERCSAMKYLFCKPVAECLVQLQVLIVNECPVMEVIVMNEGTSDGEIINFSKLKTLLLRDMPSLTSFYRENNEMHWILTDNSVIQPLFDGMVTFPSLEDLNIGSLKFSDIWGTYYSDNNSSNNNIVSSSFRKLKKLEVSDCGNLESVIPLAMLHWLRNLETLKLWNCSSLRNAFPPCIARDLIHLKVMNIRDCGMREIIGEGEQEAEITDDSLGVILFPKLTMLTLIELKKLTSFWCYQGEECDNYKVKFPSLVNLRIMDCGEINLEAIELGRDDSTCRLKTIYISSISMMHLPCKWQLQLYNLEMLELIKCWWHDLKSLNFPKLKVLEVKDCGCSALFTISGFRSLQKQLQTLEISKCAFLKELVEYARGDENAEMEIIKFSKLNSVFFDDLPNLESFLHGANYKCYMPAVKKVEVYKCGLSSLFTSSVFRNLKQLQILEISSCHSLKDIVEDLRDDEHFMMDPKTVIRFQLDSVVFKDLPILQSFIHSANYECCMPVLKTVEVANCGLSSLFTSSVFRNLEQLRTLAVLNCTLLQCIVEDGMGDETSINNVKITRLVQLSSVTLEDLPNLRSFSRNASYSFDFPTLKNFHLLGCPQLDNFISLKTSTGLVSVYTEGHHVKQFTDLNDFINIKSQKKK